MLLKKTFRLFSISKNILKTKTEYSNIKPQILNLIDKKIYKIPNHPINSLYNLLKNFYSDPKIPKSNLQTFLKNSKYKFKTEENPIVTKFQNFDSLLIKPDHVSRKKTDTFYLSEKQLLRTHTSAHQHENINKHNKFCVFADVYRRDEIDSTHYPAFHQMEGVSIYSFEDLEKFKSTLNKNLKEFENKGNLANGALDRDLASRRDFSGYLQNEDYFYREDFGREENLEFISFVVDDMKETHENLIKYLLNDDGLKMRWNKDYFPFTEPSYELEVFFNDKWVEMLGCGIIHKDVIDMTENKQSKNFIGWASGIGIERLAMLLFKIPDIRLFWSQDKRFLNQFKENKISHFKPFSKYPSCFKDISFWIGEEFSENDFYDVIREISGDLVEKVECIDTFFNKKINRTSKAFRIFYRSLERTLTNEEIDVLQFKLRDELMNFKGLELR